MIWWIVLGIVLFALAILIGTVLRVVAALPALRRAMALLGQRRDGALRVRQRAEKVQHRLAAVQERMAEIQQALPAGRSGAPD